MSIQQNSLRHTSVLIQTSRDCSTQPRNPSSPNMLMMTQSPTFSKYSKLMRRLLVLKSTCKNVKTFGAAPSDTKQTCLLTLTGLIHTYLTNTDCTHRNIKHKIHKLRTITATWNHCDMSLKGKALVINGLLTSTLWYFAANVHFPPWRFRKSKISSTPFYGIINDHSLIVIS